MPAKTLSSEKDKRRITLVLGPGPEQTPDTQELWHFPSGGRMSTCARLRRSGSVGRCRRRWMTGRWNAYCFHPRRHRIMPDTGQARACRLVSRLSGTETSLASPCSYCGTSGQTHPHGYQVTPDLVLPVQYRVWAGKLACGCALCMKAGEKLFVDYARDAWPRLSTLATGVG